jgi:hypothetical protein
MTHNQERVLDPIIRTIESESAVQHSTTSKGRPGLPELAGAMHRAAHASRNLRSALDGSAYSKSQLRVHLAATNGAAEYCRLVTLVRKLSVRAVVVASQQHWSARSLVAAALAARIPSIYVPHAPTALTVGYADLPTDVALLRGTADVDAYKRLGADAQRLFAVGDPSITTEPSTRTNPRNPLVFATSTWPEEWIKEQINLIRTALPGLGVVVAPHPRADIAWLRGHTPSNWVVADRGSTQQLLAQGCDVVVTAGSGVGLEAALSGAHVLNIATRKEYVAYVFHTSSSCINIRSVEQLREGVLGPRQTLETDTAYWLSFWGRIAARRAADLIMGNLEQYLGGEGANDVWAKLWPDLNQ